MSDGGGDVRSDWAEGMAIAQERIADTFNRCWATVEVSIEPSDVLIGRRRTIQAGTWTIEYVVRPDDAGFPSLEFYATNRLMWGDIHRRIWADGVLQELEAMLPFYSHNPKVPGSEEAAKEEYVQHNRRVADRLREAGFSLGSSP